MNIFINKVPKTTAWGGGNKTVERLTSSLIELGHNVINNITAEQINDINKFNELSIDAIFCFDPRPNHQGITYNNMYFMKKHFYGDTSYLMAITSAIVVYVVSTLLKGNGV